MISEELAMRLLALGQYGCYLVGRDGHIYIEPAFHDVEGEQLEHSCLHYVLKKAGVSLNNKIYGGVLEALDTIDEALRLAGHHSLLNYYSFLTDTLFLGNSGIGKERISVGEVGTGGLN